MYNKNYFILLLICILGLIITHYSCNTSIRKIYQEIESLKTYGIQSSLTSEKTTIKNINSVKHTVTILLCLEIILSLGGLVKDNNELQKLLRNFRSGQNSDKG